MTDTYLTIQKATEGLFKDKGSKFFAYAFPIQTEEEIKQHITDLKKQHHGARHWCYGFRLGADKKLFRANDDGEPSGTAGKPILNQIISADLTDVLVVVVRYFGGTLLGTSGLIQAYKTAAADALQQSVKVTKYITQTCKVNFNTEVTNLVMRYLKEFDAEIVEHTFDTENEIIFTIRLSFAEKLRTSLKENNINCNPI
ncbi:MAG: IMPACT family protein [Bacteroidia bacterium]